MLQATARSFLVVAITGLAGSVFAAPSASQPELPIRAKAQLQAARHKLAQQSQALYFAQGRNYLVGAKVAAIVGGALYVGVATKYEEGRLRPQLVISPRFSLGLQLGARAGFEPSPVAQYDSSLSVGATLGLGMSVTTCFDCIETRSYNVGASLELAQDRRWDFRIPLPSFKTRRLRLIERGWQVVKKIDLALAEGHDDKVERLLPKLDRAVSMLE
jgi:hypothetical protein